MPALGQGQWDQIRIEMEAGSSISALARRYGVSRGAIQKLIRSGNWNVARPERPQLVDADMLCTAVQQVIEIIEPHHHGPDEIASENQHQNARGGATDGHPSLGNEVFPGDPTEARMRLIEKHQQQWHKVNLLQELAYAAVFDETFRPADAEKSQWTHKDRLTYAHRLMSMFSLTAAGLLHAQEGQRRAFSFDYKDQLREAKAIGVTDERRDELMRSIRQMSSSVAADWQSLDAVQPLPSKEKTIAESTRDEVSAKDPAFEV